MSDGAPTASHEKETKHKQQPAAPAPHGPAALVEATWPLTLSAQRAIVDPSQADPADILALQHTAGNQAVSHLLADASPPPSRPTIQTKLTIGPVGDRHEQEADQAADQILSMPLPSSSANGAGARRQPEDEEEIQAKPLLQRQEDEEEIQAKPLLQRLGDGSFEAGSEMESRLAAQKGGGSPLPDDLRDYMEPRFGADFSEVRVHTDSEAAQLSRDLSAQAFTHGQDIYMGPGRYDPGTTAGKRLLAHELTHVVQQSGQKRLKRPEAGESAEGSVQRWPWSKSGKKDKEEQEDPRFKGVPRAGEVGNEGYQRYLAGHMEDLKPGEQEWVKTHLQATGAPKPSSSSPAGPAYKVITFDQWLSKSSRVGRFRSAALLEIDGALAAYHASYSQPPAKRLELLNDLFDKIRAWQDSKRDEEGEVKSGRAAAVADLKQWVVAEQNAMADVKQAGTSPTSAAAVVSSVQDLYGRSVHELHAFLSKKPTSKSRETVTGYWKRFRTEAMRIEHAADKLDQSDDEAFNAHLYSLALREAMRAFRTISYRHLGSTRPDTKKTRLATIRQNLSHLVGQLRGGAGQSKDNFLLKVRGDIEGFAALAGADKGVQNSLKALDEDETPDFELIEETLNALDLSTTMMGYQGTGGKGNEGFQEFWKPGRGTENAFSGLDPGTTKSQDVVSGVFDMENALGGLESDAIAVFGIIQTWKKYKDPKSTEEEKAEAKQELILQMAQTPLSTIANVLKFTGGALTAHRGDTGSLAGSNFGFTAEGTDVSTDVKMAGDFAGLFAGIIATIGKVIDLVKFIKSGGGKGAKAQKRTTRKDLEAVGNGLRKYTGVVASLAGNFKAAAKLGYQIAGKGQLAAEKASEAGAVANLGGAVPGLKLAFGVMQAIQHGYKLVRIGIRRLALTKRIEQLVSQGLGDLKQVEATEFAHGALVKRSNRIGINLGHALSAIVAAGFDLSGIGLAPGMVISLSSSALKIGQVALRKGKQWGRNRKAKQRAKKDEQRGGTESYKEWKQRKKLQAAQTGRWQQFKTAMDIKFTFNWDKSSENKESTNREVALEILRMDDKVVYDAIGVTDALEAEKDFAKRLKIVLDALKKRD